MLKAMCRYFKASDQFPVLGIGWPLVFFSKQKKIRDGKVLAAELID